MTAKRFTIEIDDENIAHILDNGTDIGQYNLCKLLNNLFNENERLKSENNMLRVTIGRNEAYINRLTHQSEWSDEAKRMYPLKEEGKQYRS